jgi:hypothetical protein
MTLQAALIAFVAMVLALPAGAHLTAGADCRHGAASAPSPGATPRKPSATAPLAVAVNCIDMGVGAAAPASAPAAAAAPPAWAASSAAAADELRRRDQALRHALLERAGWLAAALGGAAALLALLAAIQAARGDGFRATSHWGGFGDSAGGWQVSAALASLLAAAVLAAAAALIVHSTLAPAVGDAGTASTAKK